MYSGISKSYFPYAFNGLSLEDIIPNLRVYEKNSNFITPFHVMFETCKNRDCVQVAQFLLGLPTTFDVVKS